MAHDPPNSHHDHDDHDPLNPYQVSPAAAGKDDAGGEPSDPEHAVLEDQDEAAPADEESHPFAQLVAQHHAGSGWFYWVAGLSLVNSVLFLVDFKIAFIFGLAITQVFDALGADIGQQMGGNGRAIAIGVAIVLDLCAAGTFILLGMAARRLHRWAYVLGIILYTCDGVLMLLIQDLLGVLFHGWVLFMLVRGLIACWKLRGMLPALAAAATRTTTFTT